jgi:hypothetical protein
MSKRKLNVGDRVKVVGYVGTGWHGLIGVIDAHSHFYHVTFENPRSVFYQRGAFGEKDLELVEEESTSNDVKREFRVGDKVRFLGARVQIEQRAIATHIPVGTVGTITYGKAVYDLYVRFEDVEFPTYNDDEDWGVYMTEIELVAPSPSSKKPRRTVERTIKLVGVVSITQADIKRDHGPHESGIVEVDGKRIDAEAEFYRLLANTPKDEPKRKRRKKTA